MMRKLFLALLFCLLSSQAFAALSIDGTATGESTGGTTVSTSSTTLTTANAGDIIVVVTHAEAVTGQGNFPTVSGGVSGCSLTWAKRNVGNFGPGGIGNSYNRAEVWWAYAASTISACTITATWGGVTIDDMTIVAFGVTGFSGTDYHTNPWDNNGSLPAVATSTTSTTPTVTGISTNGTNDMVLGLYGSPDSANSVGTIGGSTATLAVSIHNGAGTNNSNSSAEYLDVASASGISVTFGVAANGWILFGDALNPVGTPSGGGSACQSRSLMGVGC